MNRKKVLTLVAVLAALIAIVYLAVVLLWELEILPYDATEEKLFLPGYLFMPLPVTGFLAGIALQLLSIRTRKKKKE